MNDPFLAPGNSFNRLLDEYDKHGSLVIGVDFDGTFHDYHKEGHVYPKVLNLLDDLVSIGCKIIICTAYPDLSYVQKYVDDNDIPCHGINTDGIPFPWESRKPFFSALLDDRAGLIQVYDELRLIVDMVKSRTL